VKALIRGPHGVPRRHPVVDAGQAVSGQCARLEPSLKKQNGPARGPARWLRVGNV